MNINWKRVVVAAICSELLLLVIRFPFLRYDGLGGYALNLLTHFIPLFLGGLWVARKIESRFVLHGVLVGVVANLLLVLMAPIFMRLAEPTTERIAGALLSIPVKILASGIGAYIGGIRRKKLLSAQTG
jgi:putative membrane protein (TIGR04086 family)